MSSSRPFLVLLGLCLALLALPGEATDLFRYAPEAPSVTAAARLGPGEASRHTVRVDPDVLATAPESLWLELAPGEHHLAFLTDLETTANGGVVWRGRFADGDPELRTITLSLHDGLLYGGFGTASAGYTLRPTPSGDHLLIRESPRSLSCETTGSEPLEAAAHEAPPATPAGTLPGNPAPLARPTHATAAAAASPTLGLFFLYPPEEIEAWGGRAYAVAHAHHAADSLTTAFLNSRIDGRAIAVGLEAWRSSSNNMAQIRRDAQRDQALGDARDRAGGDLVVIFTHRDAAGCGLAFLQRQGRIDSMDYYAYSLTSLRCDGFNHGTMVHEIGHNLGANHEFDERSISREDAVFPYAFAYSGSIMAYGSELFFTYFSNPSITRHGSPRGIEGKADNARALNQTVPVAATWRSGGSQIPRNGVKPPVPPPPTLGAAQPTEVRAVPLSSTEIELSWMSNSTGVKGFHLEIAKGGGAWRALGDAPATVESAREVYVVTDLLPNTRYRFRVQAFADNPSIWSDPASATTLPTPVAAAPTGPAAQPVDAAGGAGALLLSWQPVDGAEGYQVRLRTADPAGDRAPEAIAYSADGTLLDGLAPATPYTLEIRAVNVSGASPWSEPVSVTTAGAGGPCVSGSDTLCLSGGRFEVRAAYRNPHAGGGHGQATAQEIEGSERTGFFTFFNPANVELGVKMLDGRALNGNFWVFYGALSDVEYWLSVRDTVAGGSQTYHNPAFELCGLGDTAAFPRPLEEEPGGEGAAAGPGAALPLSALAAAPLSTTAAAEGACVPDAESLCLAGGRFRVEVEWENPHDGGATGTGKVMPGLGTDLTGHFWFFRPDNLELSVKILDGTALNGHHWIFWGGLSDVGYTLIVTDTENGEVHRFTNPPLTLCGGSADDVL